MRSGQCSGSAGRRWPRRMTGCTPVHGNIQNATAKAWRASSEPGYRQNHHQIWCSWVSTGQACYEARIDEQWATVPDETIKDIENPTGQYIACYRYLESSRDFPPNFYCFIPISMV